MAAKMLELQCPGCEELLELDRGFAGGVCRCFQCGTLMTVPADPREASERLTRPERPNGSPGKTRPSAPPGRRSDSRRPERPERPDRPETPGSPRRPSRPESSRPVAPPSSAATETVGSGAGIETYVTASGKTFHVDVRKGIPTAQKRKLVRYTTYGVFFAIVGVFVVVCVVAVAVLLNSLDPSARRGPIETFVYDPQVNPYTLDKPNALGLPLRERTVVVVDASEDSAASLPAVQAALARGLRSVPMNVVYATSGGPVTSSGVNTGVASGGQASLAEAVRAAMRSGPGHVIIVSSHRPSDAERRAIEDALAATPGVIVDAVAVERESVALDEITRAHGGRYVRLTPTRLAQWQAEAE